MIQDFIPSVLQQPHGNSLSTERVIRLALELLDYVPITQDKREQQVLICQDDLRDMLRRIK